MSLIQLSAEEMLTTTRSVRKRLDFSRPVEPEVIRECLELAVQAPTGANSQGWHFVVVTDQEQGILIISSKDGSGSPTL
jgi:nitroreductase